MSFYPSRRPRPVVETLPSWLLHYFQTGEEPEGPHTEGSPGYELDERSFGLHPDGRSLADLWVQHRDIVLAEWVREHPGTRPPGFWDFDPRARFYPCGRGPDRLCDCRPGGGPQIGHSEPIPRLEGETDRDFLARLGVLLEGE